MVEQNSLADNAQFKRNIGFKLRIGDLLQGKAILNGDKFSYLELGDKKIIRCNIIGNVIDKYQSESSSGKSYIFVKIDDGSGQISLKAFSDDSEKLKDLSQGETIICIGSLRHFNNETYISPEIIKKVDPRYLLVRKLEIEKEKNLNTTRIKISPEMFAIKDKILKMIKDSEVEGGIEVEKIILQLREATPDIINQEIRKLLEEGIIFEPRPGKIRWLG
ncbi:hypothetical protein COU57_06415 [Candidatus Pacearchaeota archaeon CG10_big_fil_rev_8_21_14_0_10_32_14]|nr:MAG: hypothetical protein COU57_06415 [Candidatus Pacearchaeota archaeon CG10_big_fil_rev_8_21_14_0_10_32_14]